MKKLILALLILCILVAFFVHHPVNKLLHSSKDYYLSIGMRRSHHSRTIYGVLFCHDPFYKIMAGYRGHMFTLIFEYGHKGLTMTVTFIHPIDSLFQFIFNPGPRLLRR